MPELQVALLDGGKSEPEFPPDYQKRWPAGTLQQRENFERPSGLLPKKTGELGCIGKYRGQNLDVGSESH